MSLSHLCWQLIPQQIKLLNNRLFIIHTIMVMLSVNNVSKMESKDTNYEYYVIINEYRLIRCYKTTVKLF